MRLVTQQTLYRKSQVLLGENFFRAQGDVLAVNLTTMIKDEDKNRIGAAGNYVENISFNSRA